MSISKKDYSVLMPFLLQLDISSFKETNQKKIMLFVTKYLLGLSKYSETLTSLKKYDLSLPFQGVLKTMSEQPIKYSRNRFRRYARKEEVKIHAFDQFWLDRLKLNKTMQRNIKVLRYPTEGNVLDSMKPAIYSKTRKLHTSTPILHNDNMMNHFDISQDIALKIILTYRLYIHGFKTTLDEKAFYACLHSSVSTGSIDMVRTAQTWRRNNGKALHSLYDATTDTYIGDSLDEDITLRNIFPRVIWCPNPEEVMISQQDVQNSNLTNLQRCQVTSRLEDNI